jgi:hypothetical protein
VGSEKHFLCVSQQEEKLKCQNSLRSSVLKLESDEPSLFNENQVEMAERYAVDLTKITGGKWQLRPHIVDHSWRKREEKKFYDGTYHPVPWDSQRWFRDSVYWENHFAHLSIENDVRIAYTPNQDMGLADRQKRVRPGAYLAEYFSRVISSDTIREIVAEFSITHEDIKMGLARTAEDIVDVYKRGPRSCMDGSHNFSYLPVHPTAAYAGPDLAVAYLTKDDADMRKKVCNHCFENEAGCSNHPKCSPRTDSVYSARCVVWPERKIYNRPYGDVDRLVLALKKEGYKNGSITGARLSKIPHKHDGHNAFVAPYIDGTMNMKEEGNFLKIDAEGYFHSNGGGYVIDNRPKCSVCDKLVNMVQRNFLDRRGRNFPVCSSCFAEHGVRCIASGYYLNRKDAIQVTDTIHIGMPYIDQTVAICSKTKTQLNLNSKVGTVDAVVLADGTYVAAWWFKEANLKKCSYCEHGLPEGKFKCGFYTNCYGQSDWTVVQSEYYGPSITHRNNISLKDQSKYVFEEWKVIEEKISAERVKHKKEALLKKELMAKQARALGQKRRRERERAAKLAQLSGRESERVQS